MNQKIRFETATVTLTPVSPIHISIGNSNYGSADLVHNNELILINEEELGKILYEKSLMNDYLEFVQKWIDQPKKDQKHNMIKKFFEKPSVKKMINFDQVLQRICPPENIRYPFVDNKFFIRNGKNQPYIPGSSLKGAIRTAILYKMVKEKQGDFINSNYLDKKFNDAKRNFSRSIRKTLDDDLIASVFEDYDITDNMKNRPLPQQGSNTDFMRAISITDSSEINLDMVSLPVNSVSLDPNNSIEFSAPANEHEMFFNFKDIDKQPVVKFNITIDHEILSYFKTKTSKTDNFIIPFNTMTDIQNCLDEFYQNVWYEECLFFCGYPPELSDVNEIVKEAYEKNRITLNSMIENKQKDIFIKWLFETSNFKIGSKEANEIYDAVIKNPDDLEKFAVEVLRLIPMERQAKEFIPALIENNADYVSEIIKFYKEKPEINFRLGYGTGIMGMTIFPLVNQEYRKMIRNLLKNLGDTLAPNSRRLVFDEEMPIYPLGWARLDFEPSKNI